MNTDKRSEMLNTNTITLNEHRLVKCPKFKFPGNGRLNSDIDFSVKQYPGTMVGVSI